MSYDPFTPLNHHFDSGFGGLADAFGDAAECLSSDKEYGSLFNRHLPICFLHRHAIELYLKSAITILHRRFKMPNPSDKHEPMPVVKVGDKWKPIHAVHSILTLYEHLCVLLIIVETEVKQIARIDLTLPKEMGGWIRTVEDSDAGSTYFRYPTTREAGVDAAKSAMKQVEPEVLEKKMRSEFPKVHAFVLVDNEGNTVEAFENDAGVVEAVLDALRKSSEVLATFHAAMRAELTGGW